MVIYPIKVSLVIEHVAVLLSLQWICLIEEYIASLDHFFGVIKAFKEKSGNYLNTSEIRCVQ